MECNDDDGQYIETLGLDCRRYYWGFDDSMHWPWTANLLSGRYGGKFDRVFFANKKLCERVGGARYLPYAADERHFKPGTIERTGAATIGSQFKERVDFCRQANVELISGLYREKYISALQRLKIHVHNHESGGDGLIVMRPFETMACGALLMAPAGLMDELFSCGIHYVAYDGPEDCKRKVARFLECDDEREAMASAALHCVQEKHTYLERAKEMLDAIAG
jgi:glycosyltransferase involved in cell wall biosynthesis